MIRLAPTAAPLTPLERFTVDLLLDLSRLARADDLPADADVVRLLVTERPVPGEIRAQVDTGWGIVGADGEVRVPRAALAALGALAGGVSEQRSAERDRYDRVPSAANALVAAGLEAEPLVSRAAVQLRGAARRAAGRRAFRTLAPWPFGHRWAAGFTHDLDVVALWPAFTLLRLAELMRKGHFARAARTVAAAVGALARRPVWDGVRELLDVEERHGVRSTWFVLCGTPTARTARAGDLTYSPESAAARRILDAVAAAGHEIGLHGSFDTMDRAELFGAQRGRLRQLVPGSVAGVRQHYLRTRHGTTEHAMAGAGFTYDSTWGFSDRNGFRLGVADTLPAWDAAGATPAGITTVPFTWMDRSLSKYRGVEEPDAWIDDALALAAKVEAVDGLWVGIWHPNLVPALGFPGAPRAFDRLAREVAGRGAWRCALGEAVAWRAARRSTRVAGLRPDGSVEATYAGEAMEPPSLEAEDGHALDRIARRG